MRHLHLVSRCRQTSAQFSLLSKVPPVVSLNRYSIARHQRYTITGKHSSSSAAAAIGPAKATTMATLNSSTVTSSTKDENLPNTIMSRPDHMPEEEHMTIEIKQQDDTVRSEQIIRSFPKASPTKLRQGLERLLSSSGIQSSSPRWKLCGQGTAISRTVILDHDNKESNSVSGDELTRQISDSITNEANDLNHHPHISTETISLSSSTVKILVLTCTTHSPRLGLSLKDIRLSDKIDQILSSFPSNEGGRGQEEEEEEGRLREVAEKLLNRQLADAEGTSRDPGSRCNLQPP